VIRWSRIRVPCAEKGALVHKPATAHRFHKIGRYEPFGVTPGDTRCRDLATECAQSCESPSGKQCLGGEAEDLHGG
jgi:hypothetical protein